MKPSPSMFDPGRHEWHEKMVRHFAGTLPAEEQRALNQALEDSEELRREFALLAVQQVHVGQLHEEEAGKIIPLEQTAGPKTRSWYGRWQAAAAACAMLLAVALLWPRGSARQPEIRFASIQGEVWVQHGDTKHRAKTGLILQSGEVVQTLFGAEAVLAFALEPTRIALAEESVFTLPASNGAPFVLEAGTMSAVIAPQPRGRLLRFHTPQAEVVILGTEFRLACNATTTHLAVGSGNVELRRNTDGAFTHVGAGQFVAVGETAPLAPTPSPPQGQGTGLLGEYFPGKQFNKAEFRRVDPVVQFDWGTKPPGRGLNFDHFLVRWTGFVQPRFSERYTFELVADDGVRLWLDGRLLIDQWDIRNRQTKRRETITLEAGRKYDFKLEYFEASGKAFVSLYWQSESQPREIIPQSQLYPSANAPGQK